MKESIEMNGRENESQTEQSTLVSIEEKSIYFV